MLKKLQATSYFRLCSSAHSSRRCRHIMLMLVNKVKLSLGGLSRRTLFRLLYRLRSRSCFVVLRLTEDIPSWPHFERWAAEPLKALVLRTKCVLPSSGSTYLNSNFSDCLLFWKSLDQEFRIPRYLMVSYAKSDTRRHVIKLIFCIVHSNDVRRLNYRLVHEVVATYMGRITSL